MSRPSALIREMIEQYEQNGLVDGSKLLELERSILRREGRYDGMIIGRDYSPADNDELAATKAHLEDMRRIVFEDKS